jgi:DNA-binding MarR family transcriptional regulator
MGRVVYKAYEELTSLERVLQLHGDFRRILEPIRVTPLQAGVLLFLRRHAKAKLTDAAMVLGVRLPTMSTVVKDLVQKRWVTKRRSVADTRAVSLSLSREGQVLARRIKDHVRDVRSNVTPMKEASS